MPVTLTKAQLKKIEVEQRKVMREKHKNSAFITRTRQIFNAEKNRANKEGRLIRFTIDDVRRLCSEALEKKECPYCTVTLTLSKMALDHRIPVARGGEWIKRNMQVCCKSCNWRKGIMTDVEFDALNTFVRETFKPKVVADIWRRLVLGGKWSEGR